MKRRSNRDFEYFVNNHVFIWKFNFAQKDPSQVKVKDIIANSLQYESSNFKRENNESRKNLKRFIKNALKTQNKKYKDLSDELNVDKVVIKKLFKKQLTNPEQKDELYKKLKLWAVNYMDQMNSEIFNELVNNYGKPSFKHENDQKQPYDEQQERENTEIVILENQPPGLKNYEPSFYKDFKSNNFLPINFHFNNQNLDYDDQVLWDCSKSQNEIYFYCYQIIKDILKQEQQLEISPDQLEGKICDNNQYLELVKNSYLSVSKQIQQKNQVLKLKDLLINWQFTNASNKENDSMLNIQIQVNEGEFSVSDQFQWDLTTKLEEIIPFSEIMTDDLNLPDIFIQKIAMQIYDQILNYLESQYKRLIKFCTLSNFQLNDNDFFKRQEFIQNSKQNLAYTFNETLPITKLTLSKQELYFDREFLEYNDLFYLLLKNVNNLSEENKSILNQHTYGYNYTNGLESTPSIGQLENHVKQMGMSQFNGQFDYESFIKQYQANIQNQQFQLPQFEFKNKNNLVHN